jgi:rare lipoprotein A (peptidoglycan hydrolase)
MIAAAFAAESIVIAAVPVFLVVAALATIAAVNKRREERARAMRGVAAWRGEGYSGRRMANGERYDASRYTAAMHTGVPLGARMRVYRADGHHVDVTVTDRSAAIPIWYEIELSEAAFRALAPLRVGRLAVEVRRIE